LPAWRRSLSPAGRLKHSTNNLRRQPLGFRLQSLLGHHSFFLNLLLRLLNQGVGALPRFGNGFGSRRLRLLPAGFLRPENRQLRFP